MAKVASKVESEMSMIDTIYARRSVRSYSPLKLQFEAVRALLAAAVRAPTAVHEEPWAFVVVQDPVALKRLSDSAKPLFLEEIHRAHLDRGGHSLDNFAQPDFNIFYNASTLIVICAKLQGPFVVADCWLAAENLILAACSMGLGTCVIGSAVPGLNTPETKAMLGIPAEFTAIAPIIVGIPSGDTPPTSREEPRVLYWK
jgi:nitroreductase